MMIQNQKSRKERECIKAKKGKERTGRASMERATMEKATMEKATTEKATMERATMEKATMEKDMEERERKAADFSQIQREEQPLMSHRTGAGLDGAPRLQR
eukprot:symbB.v1.2.002423.t1/scaffold129.1/size311234/12